MKGKIPGTSIIAVPTKENFLLDIEISNFGFEDFVAFIVIFKSFCAFTEELAIKWLHTLLGKTQLFMRTGI